MKTELAPIALFVYNRPWHAQQTVKMLQRNELSRDSGLFIFSDGPKDNFDKKKVDKVRRYINTISGFKSVNIIERKQHLGLFKSIIEGVTEIVTRFGRIIVMEDDLVSSPFFLKFINEALEHYEFKEEVVSINGYGYPVRVLGCETFFMKGADCWGWATWKRGWDIFDKDGQKLFKELKTRRLTRKFDMDGAYPYTNMLKDHIEGKRETWAILWYASTFLKNKLTLCPAKSLIWHIGNDGSGTNFGKSNVLDCKITSQPINIVDIPVAEDLMMHKKIEDYFKSIKPSFLSRIKRSVLSALEIK